VTLPPFYRTNNRWIEIDDITNRFHSCHLLRSERE
jgi:hypothetical protein